MSEIKIIIVDDHTLFRVGLKSVINERMPNVSILAEYSSGKEFLVHLENNTKPDLILLDIIMSEISGIEIAKVVKKYFSDIKILVISSEVTTKTITELLDIGVNG
ncbi:MAG: response regulator, partial [Bacteroidia bacterium]|nr:response regulator [Bacteroidia bacterium]